MNITNKKTVTDIITINDIKRWTPRDIVIISAGTGTGKSYFIKNSLYQYAKENNKKILFLIHRTKAFRNGDEDMGGLTPNQQQRVAYEKMQSLRDEIKRLKIEINGNVNNTVKIKALENKMLVLEEFLFVDDVINVYSKHKGTYNKFADKGFYYGGHKYVQRSAGSGNLKQHTVTFIREDINADVIKKIRVGFSYDIETSEILPPAKFGAYL